MSPRRPTQSLISVTQASKSALGCDCQAGEGSFPLVSQIRKCEFVSGHICEAAGIGHCSVLAYSNWKQTS